MPEELCDGMYATGSFLREALNAGIPPIFCKNLNKAFGPPFLPEGFVEATDVSGIHGKPTIALRIGARTVTFTLRGEWIGEGTELTSEWFVG